MAATSERLFYAPFAQTAVKQLLNLVNSLPKQPNAQALETLNLIKATLVALQETALATSEQVVLNGKLCEERLEELESELNRINQEIDLLEKRNRELSAHMAKVQTKKNLTEKTVKELSKNLSGLQKDLKRLHDRAMELKKWWWVPGYGQYLAIRTLIDNDIRRITLCQSEYKRYREEMIREGDHIAEMSRSLETIRHQLKSHSDQKTAFTKLRSEIRAQRKATKKGVVLASWASLCNITLAQKLETIERRIEDSNDLGEYLSSEVELFNYDDEVDEIIAVKDALIKFGEYCDSIPYIIKIPLSQHPTIPDGLKVTVLSSQDRLDSAPACPVIAYGGATFWPLSYLDNRLGMAVIAYDASGREIKRWDYKGARYITEIHLGMRDDDVQFVGQGNNTVIMPWQELESIVGA